MNSLVGLIPARVCRVLHFPVIHIKIIHTDSGTDHKVTGFILVINIQRCGRRLPRTVKALINFIAIIVITDLATTVIVGKISSYIRIAAGNVTEYPFTG